MNSRTTDTKAFIFSFTISARWAALFCKLLNVPGLMWRNFKLEPPSNALHLFPNSEEEVKFLLPFKGAFLELGGPCIHLYFYQVNFEFLICLDLFRQLLWFDFFSFLNILSLQMFKIFLRFSLTELKRIS